LISYTDAIAGLKLALSHTSSAADHGTIHGNEDFPTCFENAGRDNPRHRVMRAQRMASSYLELVNGYGSHSVSKTGAVMA